MKRYFVFSDVHGEYDKLSDALLSSGFDINDSSHILISDGDLFDRGKKSKECLDFIMDLADKGRAIIIMGNHDLRLYELLFSHERVHPFEKSDVKNGLHETIKSLAGYNYNISDSAWNNVVFDSVVSTIPYNVKEKLYRYFQEASWLAENKDYIITHGWIPSFNSVKKISGSYYDPKKDISEWRSSSYDDWYNAVWSDTKKIFCAQFLNGENYYPEEKKLIIGHFWANELQAILDDKTKKNYIEKQKKLSAISPILIKDKFIAIDGMANLDKTNVLFKNSSGEMDTYTLYGKVNVYVFDSNDDFNCLKVL